MKKLKHFLRGAFCVGKRKVAGQKNVLEMYTHVYLRSG